ncbi:MAG: DUF4286 family protein [Legionella sp.]|nr:DUF4286 family protein [Legionella sp.]
MIIYEVTVHVLSEVYDKYIGWLKPHIEEMLVFNGFKRALLLKEQGDQRAPEGSQELIVQYYVESMEHLTDYLNNYAQSMRNDAIQRFPEQFKISRRTFEIQKDTA